MGFASDIPEIVVYQLKVVDPAASMDGDQRASRPFAGGAFLLAALPGSC